MRITDRYQPRVEQLGRQFQMGDGDGRLGRAVPVYHPQSRTGGPHRPDIGSGRRFAAEGHHSQRGIGQPRQTAAGPEQPEVAGEKLVTVMPSLRTIEKNLRGNRRASRSGMTRGTPRTSGGKMAEKDPSKCTGETHRARSSAVSPTASAHASTAVKKASGGICTPLGMPVVPDV